MSTTASGNASQIREQLDRYVSQFGGSGVHHVAASAARAAVEEVLKPEDEKATFSISIGETVSESTGHLTVQYNITRAPQPAPAPAPAPATSTAAAAASTGAPDGTGAATPT